MASTITITQISPSRAFFVVNLDAGTDVHFKKSGAVGDDKDLSALGPGPLKSYLSRLANWASVVDPAPGAKVVWRRVMTNGSSVIPVTGGTQAVDAQITQSNTTEVRFNPTVGAGSVRLELVFVHSLQR
jgi:hypothetical protein